MRNTDSARHLRRDMTLAEQRLWKALRGRHTGYKFRRQVPVGPFIVDFLCHEVALIVEVDGGQHLESAYDLDRDRWLAAHGWEVVRYWNPDVLANLPAVVDDIHRRLAARKTRPLASPHPASADASATLPRFAGEGSNGTTISSSC